MFPLDKLVVLKINQEFVAMELVQALAVLIHSAHVSVLFFENGTVFASLVSHNLEGITKWNQQKESKDILHLNKS